MPRHQILKSDITFERDEGSFILSSEFVSADLINHDFRAAALRALSPEEEEIDDRDERLHFSSFFMRKDSAEAPSVFIYDKFNIQHAVETLLAVNLRPNDLSSWGRWLEDGQSSTLFRPSIFDTASPSFMPRSLRSEFGPISFDIIQNERFPVSFSPIRGVSIAQYVANKKYSAAGVLVGLIAYASGPTLFLYVAGGILLLNVSVAVSEKIADLIQSAPNLFDKRRLPPPEPPKPLPRRRK